MFVAHDEDGLPVVGETFNGCKPPPLSPTRRCTLLLPELVDLTYACNAPVLSSDPRIDAFAAELHWLGPQPPPVDLLPVHFLGNRQEQPDGSYIVAQDPPRSQDGRFQVTVSLARTGLHALRIKGPPADGSSIRPIDYFPWIVHLMGTCPVGQVPLENPEWLCGCAAGTQPSSAGSSDVTTCQKCPIGYLKEASGNLPCYSCLEAIARVRKDVSFAVGRTVTASAGAADIYECGCSSGFYLSHIDRAEATKDLSNTCPPFNSDEFTALTVPFRPACCNETLSSDCSHLSERLCLYSSCKSKYLARFQQRRMEQPNISGVCRSCSKLPSGLLMDGVDCQGGMDVIERLHVLPGFWRANELSEEVLPCLTPGACIGSSVPRQGLDDDLCGANRIGPFCEVCAPQFFKDDLGNW